MLPFGKEEQLDDATCGHTGRDGWPGFMFYHFWRWHTVFKTLKDYPVLAKVGTGSRSGTCTFRPTKQYCKQVFLDAGCETADAPVTVTAPLEIPIMSRVRR
jgi:hypothetical protein